MTVGWVWGIFTRKTATLGELVVALQLVWAHAEVASFRLPGLA